ncbi:cytochrome c oxidase biogenesis protein Cmc1 like-domain-containing protein [Microdochium trichocladiopsis]|uniref:COX assembly mitochondrial protein n=1 Tax=Microdochium trichocladiopsis TaxID=1682393 RepID=A0A9P9BRZ9_9PEZI|nr:cytochrome c oxidase biogenesis protein Cmc1 like-domain-containing protein [Microdochium trichocladiopsis]KAH7027805.1 cytochrome c oxidase biogenesis protein Cmc1 like-domain-containing protein [Microdochium trichocladiopsis]
MAADGAPTHAGRGSSSSGDGGERRNSSNINSTPPAPSAPSSSSGMPSRNPLPLSASQEAQVREVFNKRVRDQCADEIKAFADCARGRTFTIPFACRAISTKMNSCMALHATPEEHDRAREEWFAQRMVRAREREMKERRKIEQEKFHREWWGLPDQDPERLKAQLEKLERPERIGGKVVRKAPDASAAAPSSSSPSQSR